VCSLSASVWTVIDDPVRITPMPGPRHWRQLYEVNEILRKFDVFEGKAAPSRQQSRTR
jgi:hypothetical protein